MRAIISCDYDLDGDLRFMLQHFSMFRPYFPNNSIPLITRFLDALKKNKTTILRKNIRTIGMLFKNALGHESRW